MESSPWVFKIDRGSKWVGSKSRNLAVVASDPDVGGVGSPPHHEKTREIHSRPAATVTRPPTGAPPKQTTAVEDGRAMTGKGIERSSNYSFTSPSSSPSPTLSISFPVFLHSQPTARTTTRTTTTFFHLGPSLLVSIPDSFADGCAENPIAIFVFRSCNSVHGGPLPLAVGIVAVFHRSSIPGLRKAGGRFYAKSWRLQPSQISLPVLENCCTDRRCWSDGAFWGLSICKLPRAFSSWHCYLGSTNAGRSTTKHALFGDRRRWSLHAALIETAGAALLELRARVESDPHGALWNWDSSDINPCAWSRVRCIGGEVRMLDLKELDLRGTLAPELGKLRNLRSLVLFKNRFSGNIPKEISELSMLEILDLRSNNLSGTIPLEIGNLQSLKYLLLCGNNFNGSIPSEVGMLITLMELQYDASLVSNVVTEIGDISRQFGDWYKFGRGSFNAHGDEHNNPDGSTVACRVQNVEAIPYRVQRRRLLESSNLAAAPISSIPLEQFSSIPSFGSGSFPAIPNSSKKPSPAPAPASLLTAEPPPIILSSQPHPASHMMASSDGSETWKYILILPALILVLSLAVSLLLLCQKKGGRPIGPWKTGLSGQLQKAFVTGVPKLNRSELETACEDFSNIIHSSPYCTVFKGTLSSGVEISVASSVVCQKDWSKLSEMHFRKKVDTLSRVNHKNFVNLLGYCEEESPFQRMMVFEFASCGGLFEHLQFKELDHLDWSARVRIIMGVAYCLQYMHHELNPPIPLPSLTTTHVYLTEDSAAKVLERDFWKELVEKGKISGDEDVSELPLADTESNVYSFGILMLETISGRHHSETEGSIIDWAMEYLSDRRNISYLVDPSLKEFKSNELDAICEVILQCVNEDPMQRPTMKEVVAKLKEATGVSPEAAAPRLSPLWWAELEILSVEAS
ncbi:hypothetical protein ACLOJK_010582 [Asimina triloba]